MTADGVEGRRAFNEKRPPNFTGAIRQQGDEFPEPDEAQWERLEELFREGLY
jgi:enoyl-CoA hydratase/E-phenylitaconyl-CoA hydratase/naphthyl-2-hydroxymethylsuccinyl-CoA hydratase